MNMNTASICALILRRFVRQISTNTELNESSVDEWIQTERLHGWNADFLLCCTSGWSGLLIISKRCS